jgi:hypothetical protein
VGTAGLAGTTPLSHFAPWNYLSPSARLGAESIRVQRVPEDLIRCFFEMGQIHGVRIFGSRRPTRTARRHFRRSASGPAFDERLTSKIEPWLFRAGALLAPLGVPVGCVNPDEPVMIHDTRRNYFLIVIRSNKPGTQIVHTSLANGRR